ncbi:MAG: CCA tRNA nucleotidyltransferase [Janthinobacterium lividum]
MTPALEALLETPGLAPVLAALPSARLVGGCVRDAIAGRAVADVDLATPDPPDAATAALRAAGLRVIPTGLAHGTLTVLSGPSRFEVTTLRRDVATDGRHAVVAWTQDWGEDAARRDFTINAMSLERSGAVFDPFGGRADLAAGRVRFVGEAAARIAEDALRVLRFFRFQARYGLGEPDADAVAAIAAATGDLARLSGERVWGELRRILAAPDPAGALALMERLGVLAAVLPGAQAAGLARLAAAGGPADEVLRLAALLAGGAADVDAVAARLRLSGAERERLALLLEPGVPGPGEDDAALRRWLAAVPGEVLAGRAWLRGGNGEGWAGLRARLAAAARPAFALEGRDVVACGVAPGPEVGRLLREVRTWWVEGGCAAGREACLERLRDLVGQG